MDADASILFLYIPLHFVHPLLMYKGGIHLQIKSLSWQTRRKLRWFWESFFVSAMFLLFLTAFFYVASGQESSIKQPVLSVSISSSEKISQEKEKRPNQDPDVFSMSFLGWNWKISASEFLEISDKASRIYHNYGILIPARYRAPAEGLWLLWQLAS